MAHGHAIEMLHPLATANAGWTHELSRDKEVERRLDAPACPTAVDLIWL
jgi:hypothetical protein